MISRIRRFFGCRRAWRNSRWAVNSLANRVQGLNDIAAEIARERFGPDATEGWDVSGIRVFDPPWPKDRLEGEVRHLACGVERLAFLLDRAMPDEVARANARLKGEPRPPIVLS